MKGLTIVVALWSLVTAGYPVLSGIQDHQPGSFGTEDQASLAQIMRTLLCLHGSIHSGNQKLLSRVTSLEQELSETNAHLDLTKKGLIRQVRTWSDVWRKS